MMMMMMMTMTVTVTMMTTATMMMMMMMIGNVKKRNYRHFSSAEIFRKPFSVRGKRSCWSNMLKVLKSFTKKKKMSCLLACEQALPQEPYVIA